MRHNYYNQCFLLEKSFRLNKINGRAKAQPLILKLLLMMTIGPKSLISFIRKVGFNEKYLKTCITFFSLLYEITTKHED